jgi:DNA-binding CsgD family transcriptional regulator
MLGVYDFSKQGADMGQNMVMIRSFTPGVGGGEGMGVIGYCTEASFNNGLGRYAGALTAAERACECPQEIGFSTLVLPELIEAASRSGKTQRAIDALEQLTKTTRASGTDWALGIEARSRALMTEGAVAEGYYREAITRLGRTGVQIELARGHLLYGEWLRREKRRQSAREELRIAYEMFTVMGAETFAERARRELLATGETARKRTDETRYELTAQETQIATLAGDGRTNPEIGAELFISPRTVEWHLRKVFQKLGIGSRRELRDAPPSRQWANAMA